ncbi:MAG: AI-2E family transporter [Pleurocapsa sp. SU_196_0]|nr:AI-2E family transporter [Pleurocapsa sp. SU_196_0]
MNNRARPDRQDWEWIARVRRPLVQALLFVAAVVLGALLLGNWATAAAGPLLLVLLASVLALALNPLVVWLELRRVPRSVGAVIVVLGVVAILGGALALIAPILYAQGNTFVTGVPAQLERIRDNLPPWLAQIPGVTSWFSGDGGLKALLGSGGAVMLSSVTSAAGALLGVVVSATLLLTLVVFLLSNPQPILRGLLTAIPAKARSPLERLLARLGRQLSLWLVAALSVSTILGTALAIGLAIVGFRDAILFGAIYAVCNLVPVVGPLIGMLPAVLTAAGLGDWTAMIWALVIPMALQQLDGAVLSPFIFRRTTQLHPVSVLVSVAVFGSLMGFVGTFLAVPMTIIVKGIYEEIYLPAVNNPEVSEEHIAAVLNVPPPDEPAAEDPSPQQQQQQQAQDAMAEAKSLEISPVTLTDPHPSIT